MILAIIELNRSFLVVVVVVAVAVADFGVGDTVLDLEAILDKSIE